MTCQSVWSTAKLVLEGKLRALNAFLRKQTGTKWNKSLTQEERKGATKQT